MAFGSVVLVMMAVFVGAVAQRVAGLGFALLVAPFLVLLLGAHEGVIMVNACGLASSALIMARVWADIDWGVFLGLGIPAMVATVPASWLAVRLLSAPLSVAVGVVVLLGLGLSWALQRTKVVVRGRGARAAAGAIAGVTNAVAGAAGPPVTAYALLARIPQGRFVATLQPFFIATSVVTLAAKLTSSSSWSPTVGTSMWLLVLVLIVAGVFAGDWLQRHIADDLARSWVVALAFAGAAATLVQGLNAW